MHLPRGRSGTRSFASHDDTTPVTRADFNNLASRFGEMLDRFLTSNQKDSASKVDGNCGSSHHDEPDGDFQAFTMPPFTDEKNDNDSATSSRTKVLADPAADPAHQEEEVLEKPLCAP
eukprot:GHVU01081692.1.p1 GENE.GHVU01081692.1~~GHVU01081692.1.p1  ORF type:complete len:118 (+),score=14.94 GHVU01081692.1:1786-2139(+)